MSPLVPREGLRERSIDLALIVACLAVAVLGAVCSQLW